MVATTDVKGIYLAEFERAAQDAAGFGPEWLLPLRKRAAAHFDALGFPGRRDEEWRFTPLTSLLEVPFRLSGFAQEHEWMSRHSDEFAHQVQPRLYPDLTADRIVFYNGHHSDFTGDFATSTDQHSGALVTRLHHALQEMPEKVAPYLAKSALYDNQSFTALNTAFLETGAFIYIPRGVVLEHPVIVLYASHAPDTPIVSHPRTVIVAEENSQATIIECYMGWGDTAYFTNAVTEIFAAENAVIDHYKLNHESPQAFHIATTQIELARSTNFSSHSITLGGRLVRNDFNAALRGEGITCTLNGLYMAHDRQLVDNHTFIDHAMPHCESHELYKGILDGRAHGVFNGKIMVRQDAQKTDAKQTNQTLLLSDEAQINTKPQLEIFADDVRCTHGATVGQLSAEALFYLRSRGIGKAEARAMLTHAFANDVINRIKVEPVREALEQNLC